MKSDSGHTEWIEQSKESGETINLINMGCASLSLMW